MSTNLRKCISMQPLGSINPGGPYSYADAAGNNPGFFRETNTKWIRIWVDWLTLEPQHGQYDQAKLNGMDEQIRRARFDGLGVILAINARFPGWVTQDHNDPSVAPSDVGPGSAYEYFIKWLYNRYRLHGSTLSGVSIHILEVVNEPNLMLKPPPGHNINLANLTIEMFKTAQRVSEIHDHQIHLAGPGLSDGAGIPYGQFMDTMRATGFKAASNFIWTHHNYADVEAGNTVTTDFVRNHINGWWTGYDEGDGPVVLCTEGGGRLSQLNDNKTTQASRVGTALTNLRNRPRVGMQSNYMTWDDVYGRNSGLLDPPASYYTPRPVYNTWKSHASGASDVKRWRLGWLLEEWTKWDPAILSRHAGHVEVFAIGGNNQCYHRWTGNSGQSWSAWESLGGGCSSAPGVATMRSDLMDVFVVGDRNELWHKWWTGGGGWGDWWPMQGWCTYDPGVATMNDQHIEVFVRWGDGTLWHRWWWASGGWSNWEPLFGGQVVGSPSAVSWGDGRIDVVFRGTDNRLHHMYYSNGWHGPGPIAGDGGYATGSPEITSWKPGHLDVVVPGSGNKLWRLTYDRAWNNWEPIPRTYELGMQWSPAVTSMKNSGGRLDAVVHRGNRLQHLYLSL